MLKRNFLHVTASVVVALSGIGTGSASAADNTFKIGLILPMTGPFASTGLQVEGGVRTYLAEHGAEVAGRKVEVVLKDDGGSPAQAKRYAQELLVNEKVDVLAGFGLTPLALAVAPLATQTKTPMLIMAAQTLAATNASPYAVRTSGTIAQITMGSAQWAAKNGMDRVVTLVPEYAPGYESEQAFKEFYSGPGREIIGEIRVPMENPDFAPFVQRVSNLKPDALYVMLPSGPGAAFLKEYVSRGLEQSGIKLIAHGAVTDDDYLNKAGPETLGVVSSDYYSAAHPSEKNKNFVQKFGEVTKGVRPNFFGVAGYDGMHLVFNALEKTNGKADGDELLGAMKGQSFESPRGQVTLDPETRDFIQSIYIRKVEERDGELFNVEFDAVENVTNTGKIQ